MGKEVFAVIAPSRRIAHNKKDKNMKYCSNCNESYKNSASFCAACGGRLIDPELIAILPDKYRSHDNIKKLVEQELDKFSWAIIKENLSIASSYMDANMEDFIKPMMEALDSGNSDEFEARASCDISKHETQL